MEVNGALVFASEIKEPILAIRQMALGLDLTDNIEVEERLKKHLVKISDQLILRLNDLARLPKLNFDNYPIETVSVRAVWLEVYNELRKIDKEKIDNFKIDIKKNVGLVLANKVLLKRLMYNLCLNALEYTKYGDTCGVYLKADQNSVRIEVRDNGPFVSDDIFNIAIDGAKINPIKIDNRPEYSGLGLMLSVAFAKFMGASLRIKHYRDGTGFYFGLPISRQMTLFEEIE